MEKKETNQNFQITKNDPVTIDFYSELMPNYFPESAINAGENIQSLMVAPEQPFIFCLDKEGCLQGILRSEGSASGWVKMMFSEGKVASFELEYNIEENHFQLAKIENNKVWVSDEISLDTTQFATLDKSISWTSMEAKDASEVINKVSIGVEHVLFATETKNKDAKYYISALDELDPKPYTLPENGMKITQFELGNFQYNNGVFLLYDIGKERSFIFQSFPDPKYDKTIKVRFENDEFINCFTLVESDDANDFVYAAGTQVHQYITGIESNDFEVLTLPGKLGNIKKIAAARNGDEHSVWSLDENGLHYQTNHFFDQKSQSFTTGRWTRPILMVEEADQFSCVKGNGIRNQLFAISTKYGSELTRLWQDKTTTLWNTNTLTIKAIDGLKEVESYSAHVRFHSKAMKTFQGLNVRLSADSNIFVYVNSQSYHIGPNHEVKIPLNVLAEFTVICPVKDIAASKIYINADFLKETQAINLKGKVLERLEEKITSANGLGNVTDEKGKRLVAEGTDLKVLQNAEEGIKQMLELAKTMENDDNAPLKRTSFSIGNTNNKIVARGAVAESYSILNEGLTLGDFLHSVWDGAKQVVEFVVEKVKAGVQFVIKIGEQVFNWIVTTIREIGSFIQKIFDAIKVFFEDLFKLLAFLFDWDDIVATKNTFKDFTNEAILSLKGEIGTIKKFVDDNLEEQIGKFRPDKVTFPDELSAVDPSEPSEKTEADPRSNWLNSKKDYLHDSTDKPLKEKIPTEFSDVMQSFLSDMKDILIEAGQGIGSQMETIFAAFKQVLSGNMKFIEFLKLLMNELAVLGLTLVKLLMDLIFKSLETLLDVALVGLNKEWEIPLITQLYKSITKSDELTFLDVMCLFVAIPTTVLYKIGFGKAPFGEGATKEEFVKRGRTIFQLNLN